MRPKVIWGFELISLIVLAWDAVRTWIDWMGTGRVSSPGALLAFIILYGLFIGGLILLVSRRRSRVAMWVLIILFVAGLVSTYDLIVRGIFIGSVWMELLRSIAQAVAFGLLFTREAREWMRSRPKETKLQDTFS